jgi:hypothetical protein
MVARTTSFCLAAFDRRELHQFRRAATLTQRLDSDQGSPDGRIRSEMAHRSSDGTVSPGRRWWRATQAELASE